MTTTTETTSVRTAVDVDVPIQRAFHVFTAEIGTWWDTDKHTSWTCRCARWSSSRASVATSSTVGRTAASAAGRASWRTSHPARLLQLGHQHPMADRARPRQVQ